MIWLMFVCLLKWAGLETSLRLLRLSRCGAEGGWEARWCGCGASAWGRPGCGGTDAGAVRSDLLTGFQRLCDVS